MQITNEQKRVIIQVVNVAETGSVTGNYSQVTIVDDDPKHPGKEISYGRSQVTEWGRLKDLLELYCKSDGKFKYNFLQYLPQVGVSSLARDKYFISLLKEAGKDSVMQKCQDELFEKNYFIPAKEWAESFGFVLPLSMLVIYDSYIQSGSILNFLRKRFKESPPSKGGNEKIWTQHYLEARHDWLEHHSQRILQKSSYRTACYLAQINLGNWDLSSDICMNGHIIKGT